MNNNDNQIRNEFDAESNIRTLDQNCKKTKDSDYIAEHLPALNIIGIGPDDTVGELIKRTNKIFYPLGEVEEFLKSTVKTEKGKAMTEVLFDWTNRFKLTNIIQTDHYYESIADIINKNNVPCSMKVGEFIKKYLSNGLCIVPNKNNVKRARCGDNEKQEVLNETQKVLDKYNFNSAFNNTLFNTTSGNNNLSNVLSDKKVSNTTSGNNNLSNVPSDKKDDKKKEGLSGGSIFGIVITFILCILVAAFACIKVTNKMKQKKNKESDKQSKEEKYEPGIELEQKTEDNFNINESSSIINTENLAGKGEGRKDLFSFHEIPNNEENKLTRKEKGLDNAIAIT